LTQEIALALFYTRVHLLSPSSLLSFALHLLNLDKKWDSLRQIPYSTPGRWIKYLNLSYIYVALNYSNLRPGIRDDIYLVTWAITWVIGLMPYLETLMLPKYIPATCDVLNAVTLKDGIQDLRTLNIGVISGEMMALAQLLHQATCLEYLVVHFFMEGTEDLPKTAISPTPLISTLHHEHLHHLEVTSMIPLDFVTILSSGSYPTLCELHISPCSDIVFIMSSMGPSLISLTLLPDSSGWPPQPLTTPSSLLILCPNLKFLSLISLLLVLALMQPHPLKELSLPQPNISFFASLKLLFAKGCLPNLKRIFNQSIRYVCADLGARVMEAGVQGKMRYWQMRFKRRSIQLVDSQGWDGK
jgi:hypothetical protein